MASPSLPENEAERLAALRRYEVLDTEPEEAFDRIARLAARMLRTPIALVSLVDEHRQWFKARLGFDAAETAREYAFCAYTILGERVCCVLDAARDPRFCGNPLVAGSPCVRFYAGAPLITGDGYRIGSLCVIDTVPRASLAVEEAACLADLAAVVVDELELRLARREAATELAAHRQAEEALRRARAQAEVAERRARESHERLQQAVEILPEGFLLFDPDDRLVLCNSKLKDIYAERADLFVRGTRFETIIRESVARGLYADAAGRQETFVAELLADHREARSSRELLLANGRWVQVEERHMPDGWTVGMRVDITRLKDREASFRLLFDGNPVPMWVFDRETLRFLEVNQATLKHYGYSREQFLAMTLVDIRPPEDVERLLSALRSEGASRNFYRTWTHLRADGSLIEIDVVGQLLEFDGRPAQLSAGFDVTERNRIAAALQAAKQEAEAANRTKSQFLATMSHELRTPLNAILGFSEIIRDARMGPVGHRYRDYARDIHGSGQHLLELINDILDLSKIEVGRLELYEEHLDAAEIIKSCCRLVAERAHTGDVRLEVRVGKDLPPVFADRLRLKQILLNLLSNAVKFTPSGGCISVAATAPTGGGVEIRVADTGIGMRPEDIPIAFEPFRQIDSSQSRHYEGTGLGLPLAKRLVELHGGTLEVESEPGRGTTVRVRLPKSRVLRGADRSEAETGI